MNCIVEGCVRPRQASSGSRLCSMHRSRLHRTGDVGSVEPITRSDSERFWAKVTKDEGCWNWMGRRNRDGYGEFYRRRSLWPPYTVRAHRFAYEDAVGSIPSDLTIDHLCRNRACVRPDHLEAVTHRENTLRGEGITSRNARRSDRST